ncbi:MAG TPA: tetraacyldisaccharide 4'-kinase [Candidatus Binataceae bacterium]|nr:tetraacyldisaccharide 4'-kinase [Candidatus Binataceae bacterium]
MAVSTPAPPARSRLERLWQRDLALHERLLWTALVPASGVYRAGLAARALWWRAMKRRARPLIVSVGNLTVGGNAKTPFTLFLAARLRMRGMRIGIVSRGWGGTSRAERALLVSDGERLLADAEAAGDEAVMMAKSFAGPVAVGRRRIDAIELLEQRLGPLDAVVLDDAFQHLRLARDVDLLLTNSERGLGNGWLLPAGPMREPLHAASRADAVIAVAADAASSAAARGGVAPALPRALAEHPHLMRASLRPRALVTPAAGAARWAEMPLALMGRRVVAVSGLADAGGFYRMLREMDADLVGVLEYPDHHAYTAADWHSIIAAGRGGALFVTTEKDLVKLERFPFERDSLYALRLEVVMDLDDETRLLDTIVARRATPPAARARVEREAPAKEAFAEHGH